MNTEIVDVRVNDLVPTRQQSIRATAAQFLGVPADKVCDLLRNVWTTSNGQPPLSDAEMFIGMSMIARFGLDPIAREIYVTRTSKGLVSIVGIDGWVKVLHKSPGYDGFETEVHFDERNEIDWVEVSIYSTIISRPTRYRAYASEYFRVAGVVAKTLPSHMLRIFALRHAARLFAPIGGSVVTEEEARWMDAYSQTPEEDRTRKNTLKDKAQAAAVTFNPSPVEPANVNQVIAAELDLKPMAPSVKVEAPAATEPVDEFDPKHWADEFCRMLPEITRVRGRKGALEDLEERRPMIGHFNYDKCLAAARDAGWHIEMIDGKSRIV